MTAARNVTGEAERFFDEVAADYDRAYSSPGIGGQILRKRVAAVLKQLEGGSGEVLDAGMGAGYLCAELDRRGWTVSGLDLSQAMVDGALARLPHLRDRLVQGDIAALPFEDESFDAVVATGVLEYALDLTAAVEELARVLRRGGVAVVSFPNSLAPVSLWRGRVLYPVVRLGKRVVSTRRPAPVRMPRRSLSDVREALRRADFVEEAAAPVGVRPVPAPVSERLERGNSSLAFALAVQVVLRARKDPR
jgi:ubiquinone/menaquinone biosynthesis C-methylase UbiE